MKPRRADAAEGRAESRERRPRGVWVLVALGAAAMVLFLGFAALGIWQVQRLGWKRDLVARVEARIHAAPALVPGEAEWPRIGASRDEYRRVWVEGRFLAGHDTRVQAVTALGAGFWLLAPLQARDGSIVLVNRGFVPPDWRPEPHPDPGAGGDAGAAPVSRVTGLLRMSEPEGGFLRRNQPAQERWYSRDVAAIAAARGLARTAPYFIDADADANANPGMDPNPRWPAGGLTVTRFPDNHLPYALTWFALAAMVAAAAGYLARHEYRLRRRRRGSAVSFRDVGHAALSRD